MEKQFVIDQREFNKQMQEGDARLRIAEEQEQEAQRNLETEIDNDIGLSVPHAQPNRNENNDIGLSVSQVQPYRNEQFINTSPPFVSNDANLGHDLFRQLQRVSIPVFSGDKRRYEGWKAAFMGCIDKAPATTILSRRLEALAAVENLGHSAVAYEAAKERLDRKYGGPRRRVALYIEELEEFRPMRPGFAKDIEKFADLLDVAVVNLKEAGRDDELGNGSLYLKLQRKIPEIMLCQYHRWVFENNKNHSVEVLREWINQEAEFQMVAAETVKGLTSKHGGRTYFGTDTDESTENI